jgi:HAD superfamily hydrolase (TIGR01549 family)
LCIKAFKASIEPLAGKTFTDTEIIATFGPSEEGTIRKLIPEYYDEGVEAYLRHYEEMHHLYDEPFEGVAALLEELRRRGVRLGMVTGKGPRSAEISLKRYNLQEYFAVLETGRPEGPRKAAAIAAILESWPEVRKQEVLYVGDAPSDITACREAGIPIAAVAWASTSDAKELETFGPDYLFTDFAEFEAWLMANV